MASSQQSADAFYLPATSGDNRFCLYYPPRPGLPVRGAFVYVPPFGDEMNRTRRMAALQARQLSDAGYGILSIDLYGCGDSAGDFADATWALWKTDLALATQWLAQRLSVRPGLWALRLGALLALDFAFDRANDPVNDASGIASMLLWNPVLDGKSFMTQFLRQHLASEMLKDGNANEASRETTRKTSEKTGGTHALRDALSAGLTLEIAGYSLAPALALAIDNAGVKPAALARIPIAWIDVVRQAEGATALPTAATIAIQESWRQQEVDLHYCAVFGPSFWATQEIATCDALLVASTSLINSLRVQAS
jgi:exosortase A-associated hydrolase 2